MNNHEQMLQQQSLALKTSISFNRASSVFAARMKASIRRMGLTINQFGVMEALYHRGPMNLSELAVKLLCTPGNLTTVVDNLDKHGYAQRIANSADRRIYQIHLTTKGAHLIGAGFQGHVDDIVQTMGVLTTEEQLEFARLSKKLGKGILELKSNRKD